MRASATSDHGCDDGVPEIRIYPRGPILVRGDVRVVDHEGNDVPTRAGTFALCRCGKSRLWPTCDGTHRLVED